ncbi:integrase core domain-containing protein [Streptomyces sp. NPDC049687]|uniref:integrase core domain-containing protein n=1 Tax=Streptomyces sp. NPDC049687 TaxID=3365596 RepID=UPI00378981B2
MAEALNGTFKAELIEMQGRWKDVDQVERAIFQWVTWCNEERLHSALDYVPPAEYEEAFWRSQEQTPQSGEWPSVVRQRLLRGPLLARTRCSRRSVSRGFGCGMGRRRGAHLTRARADTSSQGDGDVHTTCGRLPS